MIFLYALSTAGMSTTTTGQKSSTCWSSTIRRRRSWPRKFGLVKRYVVLCCAGMTSWRRRWRHGDKHAGAQQVTRRLQSSSHSQLRRDEDVKILQQMDRSCRSTVLPTQKAGRGTKHSMTIYAYVRRKRVLDMFSLNKSQKRSEFVALKVMLQ